jgi:integrase
MTRRWGRVVQRRPHHVSRPGHHGAFARVQAGRPPALRKAGIRQVRFHDLRHSFASNLLAEGVDVVTVSNALGHANVHIGLLTYAHAISKSRQGAGDALARLMMQYGNKLETWASKLEIRVGQNRVQVIDLK